jgi:bifunctional enzyme CysN/CysC/sulfate adenylyltransferase subunit 1
LDVNTLHRDESAETLSLNEIGRVRFRAASPIFADPYSRNRLTGGFIVIDAGSNATVGAGMVLD